MQRSNTCHSSLPGLYRHAVPALLAGCLWTDAVFSQTDSETAKPTAPGAATPAASKSGTTTPDARVRDEGAATGAAKQGGEASGTVAGEAGKIEQPAGSQPPSPYRTGQSPNTPLVPRSQEPGAPDRQSLLGSDLQFPPSVSGLPDLPVRQLGINQPVQEPITYVAPGLYGQGQQVLVAGEGRLAGPTFRYGVSLANGYDDNSFQSSGTGGFPRNRTGFTTLEVHSELHQSKPRSLLSLSVSGGADFFWNRNQDSENYNARLALLYLYRIDPRTQVTANLTFAFLPQADYSNISASQNPTGVNSDYITASSKLDLSHTWAPHFTTNTSAAANLLYYTQGGRGASSGNFWDVTLGNEFRFSWSRNLSWVVDGRYEFLDYIDNSAFNSDTIYFLGGVDWTVSRRLTATLRAGASVRTLDAGGSTTSPYVEAAINYKTGRRGSLSLNGRYGFEPNNLGGGSALSYRLGLAYRQALTARLSGDVGFAYVRTDNSGTSTFGGTTDVYDLNAGLNYKVNRHLSLRANYAYTNWESSTGLGNYDRNRATLSADYDF